MKPNTRFLVLTLAGALAAAPVIPSVAAFAETPAQPPAAGAQAPAASATAASDKAVLTTVDDARAAMRDVHLARVALFDGDSTKAKGLTDDALSKMQSAQASEADWAVPTKAGKEGLRYLPFDSSVALNEDFVATPENTKTLGDANAKIATGDSKGAVEVLRAHDIGVSVNAALIPARDALEELRNAQTLFEGGHFYEASMALKAVEDMTVIDSWSADALPDQPGQATKAAQATPATPASPAPATPAKS